MNKDKGFISLFDKTFFKLFFSFLVIISLSLGIVYATEIYHQNQIAKNNSSISNEKNNATVGAGAR
ncbi:MAG: hypothetical protein Q7R78_02505 [bacterium]|nr:hypothetical protein [bacterium]